MTDFLVRRFVRDWEQVKEPRVRTAYGVLASVVGILCNLLLFGGKWAIGFLVGSVSVMADAFNNLSDAASSIIGFVGVKMAGKPADQEHPFGHGRVEYIAALAVAFLVLQVGFNFFQDALGKVWAPEELRFSPVSLLVLFLSIGVKLWLGAFNRKLGKRVDSQVMLATAADAMGDVVTTTATILSILVYRFTSVNIDGVVGIGVSLVVMWAGIGIARDTLEPLIGAAADPEDYRRIKAFVEGYDGVVGSHDLIIHNYGPGRSMASIHAEVPNHVDIEVSHEIIDKIEHDANRELGIFLVIHMDPIETEDPKVLEVRQKVQEMVQSLEPAASTHDFRMVRGKERTNLIFDVVVPYSYHQEEKDRLRKEIGELVQKLDPGYQCVITMEESFVGQEHKE